MPCYRSARRFGKSFAAQMLCAYYDRSCDSSALFRGKEISRDKSYQKHLNKYHVIYVDMTYVKPFTDNYRLLADYLSEKITKELKTSYSALTVSNELPATMINAVELISPHTVQEQPDNIHDFCSCLYDWYSPCKKDGRQSAISNFKEYTMVAPRKFGAYVGFTEEEVQMPTP